MNISQFMSNVNIYQCSVSCICRGRSSPPITDLPLAFYETKLIYLSILLLYFIGQVQCQNNVLLTFNIDILRTSVVIHSLYTLYGGKYIFQSPV